MSAPDIPTDYTMHTHVDGAMTLNTNLSGTINANTKMTGDPNAPLATLIIGDPNKPISMRLQGDPARPIAMTMEMLNLPRFTVQSLRELMTPKIRVRLPQYTQLCFKLFGTEVFSFCLSGEAQVITEPYVPNPYERCEIECCEPDTRPFPSQQG